MGKIRSLSILYEIQSNSTMTSHFVVGFADSIEFDYDVSFCCGVCFHHHTFNTYMVEIHSGRKE